MFRHVIALAAIALALAGCDGAPPKSPIAEPTLDLRPCVLADLPLAAKCGTLRVFEDREAGQGRTIDLNIAVVPAWGADPKPDPLFLLAGGPGQAATTGAAPVAALLRSVRKDRAIVLVDQRGTGASNPLVCSKKRDSLAETVVEVGADEIKKCLARLDADPQFYTTSVAMDDLDDVRVALGYDKINLWGGSYGTRAALEYMRRHPDHTRRVILDGAAPTDIKLTVHAGRDADRALQLMFERCAKSDVCRKDAGDVEQIFQGVLARLTAQPEVAVVRHPRTGQPEELTITRDVFAAMVRTVLYVPDLVAVLPHAIRVASTGNWAPLVAAFSMLADGAAGDIADGMFLSVVCAEDVPRITADDELVLRQNFLGDGPLQSLKEMCSVWPAAVLPEAYFEPITQPHPTLVLSGDLDPIVPPSWGELVAGRLPNARHFVVKGAGHGVTMFPCVTSALARFLDSASPMDVEVTCPDMTIPFADGAGL